jgi:glutamate mutase epsilon subunit
MAARTGVSSDAVWIVYRTRALTQIVRTLYNEHILTEAQIQNERELIESEIAVLLDKALSGAHSYSDMDRAVRAVVDTIIAKYKYVGFDISDRWLYEGSLGPD